MPTMMVQMWTSYIMVLWSHKEAWFFGKVCIGRNKYQGQNCEAGRDRDGKTKSEKKAWMHLNEAELEDELESRELLTDACLHELVATHSIIGICWSK